MSVDHPRRHDHRSVGCWDVSVLCGDARDETEWYVARKKQKRYHRKLDRGYSVERIPPPRHSEIGTVSLLASSRCANSGRPEEGTMHFDNRPHSRGRIFHGEMLMWHRPVGSNAVDCSSRAQRDGKWVPAKVFTSLADLLGAITTRQTVLDRGSRSHRPRYRLWPWPMTLTFNSRRAYANKSRSEVSSFKRCSGNERTTDGHERSHYLSRLTRSVKAILYVLPSLTWCYSAHAAQDKTRQYFIIERHKGYRWKPTILLHGDCGTQIHWPVIYQSHIYTLHSWFRVYFGTRKLG